MLGVLFGADYGVALGSAADLRLYQPVTSW